MQSEIVPSLPHGSLIDVLTGNTRSSAVPAAEAPATARRATLVGDLGLLVGNALVVAVCLGVDTLSQFGKTTITVGSTSLDARPIVGVSLLVIVGVLSVARLGLARWVIEALFAVFGVGLLAASAQVFIHLPFTPVPFTGQTFAVLLVGAAYGWRRGLSAVVLYLTLGTIGLPFFAAVSGAQTYGYLAGFALAVVVVGWLADHGWDRNLFSSILAMLLGEVAIFGVGMVWLAQFYGWASAVPFGLTPFLIGDTLKLLAAAVALPLVWFITGRARGQS